MTICNTVEQKPHLKLSTCITFVIQKNKEIKFWSTPQAQLTQISMAKLVMRKEVEQGVNTVQEYNIEKVYARSRGYCRRFHER